MEPPRSIIEAFISGDITMSQLEEVIRREADELGLTFDEAVRRADEGTLPDGPLGTDIGYLVHMLRAA